MVYTDLTDGKGENQMTNYAQIESRTAYLSTDFGEEIARKWFGDSVVDSFPRFVRGPRKGKIKGAVTWSKVVRGGWVRTARETASGSAAGYVENRVGHIFERKLHELFSDRFGTHVGKVIRDLDKEEAEAQYRSSICARIDTQMREIELERARIEAVILSGTADDHIQIFQSLISERNEDITALCEQLENWK
jgi:hypothetical protein